MPLINIKETIAEIMEMRREIRCIRSQAHRESRQVKPIDQQRITELRYRIVSLLDQIDQINAF